jgi:hypothetical protein
MDVFTGGDKLTALLTQMQQGMAGSNFQPRVEVGFLEGSTAGWNGPRPMKKSKNWKKTPKEARGMPGGVPAPYIAAVLNYGYAPHNLPPRPFFDDMVTKQSPNWHRLLAAALKANNYYAYDALQLCGLKIKEQLQASMNDFTDPPLTEATKKAKGFDHPLIDSHNLINAADFRIVL